MTGSYRCPITAVYVHSNCYRLTGCLIPESGYRIGANFIATYNGFRPIADLPLVPMLRYRNYLRIIYGWITAKLGWELGYQNLILSRTWIPFQRTRANDRCPARISDSWYVYSEHGSGLVERCDSSYAAPTATNTKLKRCPSCKHLAAGLPWYSYY